MPQDKRNTQTQGQDTPWTLRPHPNGPGAFQIVCEYPSHLEILATVASHDAARIMVAAKDLYRALILLLDALQGPANQMTPAIDAALQAIARVNEAKARP